jgi:CMP-N,N'-diacetyllegionaminic acid synthase
MTAAIIPAKGTSKGLPQKNLRQVGGTSLIGRCVSTCKKSKLLDEVYVSTDCRDIADIAITFGAQVIDRPKQLCRDQTLSSEVLLHACETVKAEIIAFVQCTAPLMTSEDVDGTIRLHLNSAPHTALATCPTHEILFRDYCQETRRQDMDLSACAGSVWAFNRAVLMRTGTFLTRPMFGYMTRARHVEIDDEDDLRIAELLLSNR